MSIESILLDSLIDAIVSRETFVFLPKNRQDIVIVSRETLSEILLKHTFVYDLKMALL